MPELFPHQQTGVDFLAQRGFAFLWDEMGLGKTAEAICACDRVGARKILVIAPAVMRDTWADEFETWQRAARPITVSNGHLTEPPGDGITIVAHAALADVPPPPTSKARRRAAYSLPNLQHGAPYDVIILDEGHEFRDYNAARARNFYFPGDGLFTAASRAWTLSGSPLVNSAADLWLPVYGPLGKSVSWYDWCKHYTVMKPSYDGEKPTGIRNAAGLADEIRGAVLRRTIASLRIPLPPLTERQIPVNLPPAALADIMQGIHQEDFHRVRLAMEEDRELISDAAISRVRHALGLAKVAPVVQHIMAGRTTAPLVVFFHHTDVREQLFLQLKNLAPHLRISWIDGKITRAELHAAKEYFQTGKLDILLVQTQAGGVGLTLTRSCHAIVAELPWTSVALQQALARIQRIGQTMPCTADIFRVTGCWLEDLLAKVIARKQVASQELLNLLTTDR